jgi:hypothetical protein
VALLSSKVSWKLCCCFVSVVPNSSAITMSETTQKCPDVTLQWNYVKVFNLSTGLFFSVQYHF